MDMDCSSSSDTVVSAKSWKKSKAKAKVVKNVKDEETELEEENVETELEDNDETTELEDADVTAKDTEFEGDEKETIYNDGIVQDSYRQKPREEDNFIVKLDKYWPHGLVEDAAVPENKNLLYLYEFVLENDFGGCENCQTEKPFHEMGLHIKYSIGNDEGVASVERFPAAFAKFVEKLDSDSYLDKHPSFQYQLKPKCCSKAKTINFSHTHRRISRSPLIKYFATKTSIIVYLKVDSNSVPLIPRNLDDIIKSNLNAVHCYPALKKWEFKGTSRSTGNFSDTFDFPEAEIPAGFKLNLRSYQLRSISWMKEIESVEDTEANTITHDYLSKKTDTEECFIKLKLGHTPFYIEFNGSQAVTRSPETTKLKPLRYYGGVLADDTGSGKTATTLGLIHSSPFSDEKYQKRYKRFFDLDSDKQSRATLIVCPSNIYKQWIFEAKKCNPKFKIYGFSTIIDHRKVSIQDIIDADIVVVSYQFLTNANYHQWKCSNQAYSYCNHFCASIEGTVNLHDFHYHRMILDEFHELAAAPKKVQDYVESFEADYVWGLTGTPTPDILSDLFKYCKPESGIPKTSSELKFKHVKRNVPNLELPPIQNETVWIELSADELALLRWKGGESRGAKAEIMMCSHYQLAEKETVAVNEFMSVEAAQKKMSGKKSQEIEALKRDLIRLHAQIETFLKENPEANVSYLQSQVKSVEQRLSSAQSNFNYFQNVFKVIGEPDKNECLICYDNIPADCLSILPCSHLYCYGCIKSAIEKCPTCPLCRSPASVKEIYCIKIKQVETVPVALKNIDMSKYSSKLVGLYRYITDLFSKDLNARVILFLQFSDLADFIGESFKDLGVEYVRVAGNVFQRQNAITKFRESSNVRLIMMSSEDSVSGINLTQATHVILLHPFWTGNEATDLAYEKQGISRAYRFGLEHQLKVVRFAVRGSIEEAITLRREKINLSN